MNKIFYYFLIEFLFLTQAFAICENFIRQHEQRNGIPEKLLSAIALIESGRSLGGNVVAWPWTINANGVPYVFDTKAEAVSKVRELQKKGIRSIDVGCMQINLMHHPDAFSSIEDAFDPEKNVAYGASFLKEKMIAQGNWQLAVAHYHSATKKFNEPYKNKVLQKWEKIQKLPFTTPSIPETLLILDTTSLVAQQPTARAQAVPAIIRVPRVDFGNRQEPVTVRFSSLVHRGGAKLYKRVKPTKPVGTTEKTPSIYNINVSKDGRINARVSMREHRIPLEVFAADERNPYSIKGSARVSP